MKFLHIADLHLGIQVHEFSMLEEQRHVLKQIQELATVHKVDCVLIAGDVYDRSVPGVEAVKLLDQFLSDLPCPVCMIAGNHDSGDRLQFGAAFMQKQGVYVQGTPVKPVFHADFRDRYGKVEVWMLPFVRPETARQWGYSGSSFQEAVDFMLADLPEPGENRRVLVAHQYVVSDRTADLVQADQAVGGIDCIRASSFQGFDYVALGHIHSASRVEERPICYSGSPLKYSFSEASQVKCAVLVELRQKGDLRLTELALEPLHDWREIKGPMQKLISPEVVSKADPLDYIRAILTDDEVYAAVGQLRSVYPNLMRIDFDNARTRSQENILEESVLPQDKSLDALFAAFFEAQYGRAMTEEEQEIIQDLLKKEAEDETH